MKMMPVEYDRVKARTKNMVDILFFLLSFFLFFIHSFFHILSLLPGVDYIDKFSKIELKRGPLSV